MTLQKFIEKIICAVRKFMIGRHGVDQLSMALLVSSILASLVASLFGSLLFSLVTLIPMFLCYWRILSKNLYKRQQENYAFLRRWYPLRDDLLKKYKRLKGMRTHKYFKCEKCGQTLRVPRGRGKLVVTCPKCMHQMHKKS